MPIPPELPEPREPNPADLETAHLTDPRRFALALVRCIRFYSRLPVPKLPFEADAHAVPDFRREPVALPLAALVIALPAGLTLAIAAKAGLDPMLAALLAITALVITTGAFHEDGLCDTADGLFGGPTPERRLDIMKDSRIGTFGGAALMLGLGLRTLTLAAILRDAGLDAAAAALGLAAMISRVEGIWLLARLPSARAYGAAAAVGRPDLRTVLAAIALTIVLALPLVLLGGLPLSGLVLALALGRLAVWTLGRLALRLIGGQTGDIAGAAQQVSEIGLLLGLAVALAG